MPYGYRLQAEYESGFVFTEDDQDSNPYAPTGNAFTVILNGLPTKAGHGRMVRYSLVSEATGGRYDWDWTKLWNVENPRPIYFRNMRRVFDPEDFDAGEATCDIHSFGYQYNDNFGKNTQKIVCFNSNGLLL